MNSVRLIHQKGTLSSEETFDALIGAFTPIGDLSLAELLKVSMKYLHLMKMQAYFFSLRNPQKAHQAPGDLSRRVRGEPRPKTKLIMKTNLIN